MLIFPFTRLTTYLRMRLTTAVFGGFPVSGESLRTVLHHHHLSDVRRDYCYSLGTNKSDNNVSRGQ